MRKTPLAAVIIPTHNRVELLRKVLDSVLAQTVEIEVLVMDDASTDGTVEMLRRDFPQVQHHREEVNKGPSFQRNKGIGLCRAPVVFTIDDDCILPSGRIFEQTMEAFDHPRVGAVTIPFANILKDNKVQQSWKKDGQVMVTFEFYGGMVAIRRDVFITAGGYGEYLFMHFEETDLAIRMLEKGYIVRLGWSDPIDHYESALRNQPRLHVLGARNALLYAFYNVPWPYVVPHLLFTSLNIVRTGLRKRELKANLQGLWRGYAGMLHEFLKRRAVSGETYRISRQLKTRGHAPLGEIESRLRPIIEAPRESDSAGPSPFPRHQHNPPAKTEDA